MQPQRTYRETVEITQEEYRGTYWTVNRVSEDAYTYYLYLGDRRVDDHIHFTVIQTGGGNNPLRKFHLTVPFPSGNTTANLHVNYVRQDNGTVRRDESFPRSKDELRRDPFKGTTIDEVSSAHHSAAENYLQGHNVTLDNVAQEFANEVWR